jgi:hypothetical protein
MAGTRKQDPICTSPKGIAVYPHLNKPDTKFDTANGGKYKVKLRMSKKECGAFIKEIDKVYEENIQAQAEDNNRDVEDLKRADKPYTEEKVDGKKTGDILIAFSMKARGKAKDGTEWENRPKFFDGAGNPIPNTKLPQIGGGSSLKINCSLSGWFVPAMGAGLTLRIRGIQLLELVEYSSGGNAEDFGFGTDGDAIELAEETTPDKPKQVDEDVDMDGDDF